MHDALANACGSEGVQSRCEVELKLCMSRQAAMDKMGQAKSWLSVKVWNAPFAVLTHGFHREQLRLRCWQSKPAVRLVGFISAASLLAT